MTDTNLSEIELPGLDCGLCGFRACTELAARLADKPELLKRCIPLAADFMNVQAAPAGPRLPDSYSSGGGRCWSIACRIGVKMSQAAASSSLRMKRATRPSASWTAALSLALSSIGGTSSPPCQVWP